MAAEEEDKVAASQARLAAVRRKDAAAKSQASRNNGIGGD